MKTVNLNVKDYKKLRKKDAYGFSFHMFICNASTLECIEFFVRIISEKYPDKKFMIEHDGIITFSVLCDNEIIYTGTHYDVESMLQEGCYTFRDKLLNIIK